MHEFRHTLKRIACTLPPILRLLEQRDQALIELTHAVERNKATQTAKEIAFGERDRATEERDRAMGERDDAYAELYRARMEHDWLLTTNRLGTNHRRSWKHLISPGFRPTLALAANHTRSQFEEAQNRAWPWGYDAMHPQRYEENFRLYQTRGGKLDLEHIGQGLMLGGDGTKADMVRFYFFCLIFDQIMKEGLTGDMVELGVYKGDTASLLASFARTMGSTIYLLDTFEGFADKDLRPEDASVSAAFKDTSLHAVQAVVGLNNTKYIQGYFPETAIQLPENASYSLVHIDCDLYAPMLSALQYFYQRMEEGGFIVMHDYSSLHWEGAEKAIDEFFADKPESVILMPDSAGSAIVRKARSNKQPVL